MVTKSMNNEQSWNSRPSSRNGYPNNSRPPSPSKSNLQTSLSPEGIIRPKAKVNSSATTRKTGTGSSSRSQVSTTPRARSPLKPPLQARSHPPSPTFKPPATIRATPAKVSNSSASRLISPTADESSARKEKTRHGSVSLHHALSFSSLHSRTPSASSGASQVDHSTPARNEPGASQITVKQGRVTAKVSRMVKPAETSNSLPPSPTVSAHRMRAPSISSSVSLGSPHTSPLNPTFYPITTATPAANPHRYATVRTSPPGGNRHHYQPFSSNDIPFTSRSTVVSKPDPLLVPKGSLHSPPNSAVSISSRSSVSISSVSYNTENSDAQDGHSTYPEDSDVSSTLVHAPATIETDFRDDLHAEDPGRSEERKVKAEAKSHRKIADLEITNRSLLAINSSLETVKHRQAKEIRELRRKLRESRLILPPRAYRAVRSSAEHDDSAEEDDGDGDGDEDEDEAGEEADDAYKRIKVLLEGLIETGRRALESEPKDFQDGGKGGTKVLSAEEVRSWRDFSGDEGDRDAEIVTNGLDVSTSSRVGLSDSSNDFLSEEEVEAMTLAPESTPPSPPRLVLLP